MPEPISIFKVNQLGDAICFLPVLQQLIATDAVNPIHLWTTPVAEPILNCSPKLNIHLLPLRDFNGAWKKPTLCWSILKQVREAQAYACLLDWDQGNVAHLAAFQSGASHIVGGSNPHVKLNRFLKHRSQPTPQDSVPQICWNIGRKFAKEALNQTWPSHPPQPDLNHLIQRPPRVPASARPILIHPGASKEYQRWPLDRYLQLASLLTATHQVRIVQPRELPPITPPPGIDLVALATLAELTTEIAHSSMLVANNSGPMNLAIALGTPSVAFWGPTDPIWKPHWQPEKHLALARRELDCLACDVRHTDSICHNSAEPLACMKRWQVSEVLDHCLLWHSRQYS